MNMKKVTAIYEMVLTRVEEALLHMAIKALPFIKQRAEVHMLILTTRNH